MKLTALSALIATTASLSAFSGSVTSKLVKDLKFTPTEDSELQEFRVTVENYKVNFTEGGSSHGSKMIASFKTKDKRELDAFAVVQYIKGCKYEMIGRGERTEVNRSVARDFFDEVIPFLHKDWVIDSVDLDPIYNSTNEMRHAYYRWNSVMDSQAEETERFYFQEAPSNNRLYVRDMPGTSSVTEYPEMDAYFATNTSLKFKTCIFKTEDVPSRVSSPEVDLTDRAIKCFEWDSSFIYNAQTKRFESSDEIHPLCQ